MSGKDLLGMTSFISEHITTHAQFEIESTFLMNINRD